MKSGLFVSSFLSLILFLASVVGTTGSSAAQSLPQTPVPISNLIMLKGSIASMQLGSNGNPEWIQSGIWVLRLGAGESNTLPSADLIVRMTMVKPDGTAVHSHFISNLTLTEASTEGNTTKVFRGTATVGMKDGPVPNVPITIKIFNSAVIGLWIGPDKLDSHFGTGPIYGTLATSSRTIAADNLSVGERQANVTSIALEKSSISYYGNATGYLTYPIGGMELPAVIMIHEWWGLNDHIKNTAEKLAAQGYSVLAVDLYGGQVATTPEKARVLSSSVRSNPQEAIQNLNAALQYLSNLPNVNSSRIASLGWCFGGDWSLQLALNSTQQLAGTVLYYGRPVTDEQTLSKITWPVLGIFGSADQAIPVESARQFDSALDGAGITNEVYIYEGVGHAFANPSGDNYAPRETADAWNKTLVFLKKYV